MKNIFLVAILALALTGCTTRQFSTVTDWYRNNESDLRTSVHTTTNLIVRTPARAAIITKAIQSVQSKISEGTLVNASMVQDYFNSYLESEGFTPGDLLVINDLMPKIKETIIKVFENEKLTNAKDQLVEINKILGWVLDVTTLIK